MRPYSDPGFFVWRFLIMSEENDKNSQAFKQTKILDAINCSPSKNFTQISNTVFRMPGLSFKAKGILCSLLSNKDGWVSYKKSLENLGAEGSTAIQSGLDELLDHGFFWSVRYQDKKTKVNKGCFWAYTDEPFKFEIKKQLLILEGKGFEIWKGSIKKLEESYQDWLKKQEVEKQEVEKQEVEKQEVEKQEVGFQVLANQGLIIPNLTNTNFQKEKDFGNAASQQLPDSDLETKDFDLEVENKPSINSNQNPPKQTKKKSSKSTKKQISPTDRIKAERILSKFNDCLKIFKQKTKQPPTDGWKPLDQNIRIIVDRLIDGYVYKDFIKIIETKIHDPWFIERPTLYVPTTLFGADKFEKYRHEDPTQYKKQSSTNKPSNGSGYTGTRKYKEAIKIKNVFTPIED